MSIITLDFETYYDKEYSLSKLTTEEYIRDPRLQVIGFAWSIDGSKPVWASGSDEGIVRAVRSLSIPDNQLLCHNTAFDGAILKWRFGIQPKYYLDTLSMARPVTGLTVGGSLAALAKMFLFREKGKEVLAAIGKRREDFTPQELAQYGAYCCNDVSLTWDLYGKLLPYSTPREMYVIDLLLRMFIDPVLELDKGVLTQHLAAVREKKEQLLAKIGDVDKDALMSNPKFAEILESLGVEPPTKVSPTTGKTTFAFAKTDEAFKELLEHEDERVQAVVAARLGVKSTLEETRTESFLAIADRGKLPIMLNYWGAHTGRASGADGINLQNLPRGGALRHAMRAPAGHVVVAADASQIEARVLAWLAGQTDLVDAFARGDDVYSLFATEKYKRPITKADKAERFVGKTCILGLGYGVGAVKLQATLKLGGVTMDDAESKGTVDFYRDRFPAIPYLWQECSEAIKAMYRGDEFELTHLKMLCTDRGIELPSGMLIRYPNLRKQDGQFVYDNRKKSVKIYGGKVTENLVQALARIITFGHMCKIDQHLRQLDTPTARYKTVLTVHDEVVVVVPTNEAGAVLSLMLDTMSVPPKWAQGLPLAAEGAIGMNYGECK